MNKNTPRDAQKNKLNTPCVQGHQANCQQPLISNWNIQWVRNTYEHTQGLWLISFIKDWCWLSHFTPEYLWHTYQSGKWTTLLMLCLCLCDNLAAVWISDQFLTIYEVTVFTAKYSESGRSAWFLMLIGNIHLSVCPAMFIARWQNYFHDM